MDGRVVSCKWIPGGHFSVHLLDNSLISSLIFSLSFFFSSFAALNSFVCRNSEPILCSFLALHSLPYGPGVLYTLDPGHENLGERGILRAPTGDEEIWRDQMSKEANQFIQYATLHLFPEAMAFASQIHAGPGELTLGSDHRQRMDLTVFRKGGHVTCINYHGAGPAHYTSHTNICPLREPGTHIKFNTKTTSGDRFRQGLTVVLNRVKVDLGGKGFRLRPRAECSVADKTITKPLQIKNTESVQRESEKKIDIISDGMIQSDETNVILCPMTDTRFFDTVKIGKVARGLTTGHSIKRKLHKDQVLVDLGDRCAPGTYSVKGEQESLSTGPLKKMRMTTGAAAAAAAENTIVGSIDKNPKENKEETEISDRRAGLRSPEDCNSSSSNSSSSSSSSGGNINVCINQINRHAVKEESPAASSSKNDSENLSGQQQQQQHQQCSVNDIQLETYPEHYWIAGPVKFEYLISTSCDFFHGSHPGFR